MLRIAVCDDMPDVLSQMKDVIQNWENGSTHVLVETFQDADTLLSAHNTAAFDIILLDVIMPFLNGLEAARELRRFDRNVKIVFLTTSPEFAVDSYVVKANNYLLKPVTATTLCQCLDEIYTEILEQKKYITIKGIYAVHRISVGKIVYIEAQNKQVLFVLSDGTSFQATQPLYSFEDKLLLSDGFYRCHRSYIVNIYHISKYTQKEITMCSGSIIPISRNYQKNFESVYFAAMFGRAGDL